MKYLRSGWDWLKAGVRFLLLHALLIILWPLVLIGCLRERSQQKLLMRAFEEFEGVGVLPVMTVYLYAAECGYPGTKFDAIETFVHDPRFEVYYRNGVAVVRRASDTSRLGAHDG